MKNVRHHPYLEQNAYNNKFNIEYDSAEMEPNNPSNVYQIGIMQSKAHKSFNNKIFDNLNKQDKFRPKNQFNNNIEHYSNRSSEIYCRK